MAWTWTKEAATVAVLFGGSLAATNLDLAFATADPNERLKAVVAAIAAERTLVPLLLPEATQVPRTADDKHANAQPVRRPVSRDVMDGGGTSPIRVGAGIAIRCGDFFVLFDALAIHSMHEQWASDCHLEDWKTFPAGQLASGNGQLVRKSVFYPPDSGRNRTSTAAAPFDIVTKFLAKPEGWSTVSAADWP
jgi:hypothetical protein